MPKIISNTIQFHIAKYNDSANRFEHLLLKRASNAKLYPNVWQVVTGTIEAGETALATAKRELEEETKLSALKIWTLPYITQYFDVKNDAIGLAPCFAALVRKDSRVILSKEHSEYKWCLLEEALDILPLPSHKEAAEVFEKYILENHLQKMFEITI
jgi:dATP pyrophosphohydrolase